MVKKINWKIWLLIIFVVLSILSIFINSSGILVLQDGVKVKSLDTGSELYEQGLRKGAIIEEINGQEIKNIEDYNNALQSFQNLEENETLRLEIKTKQSEIVGLFTNKILLDVVVQNLPSTRINTGLDLQGGARALIKADQPLTDQQLSDLISVSEQRLNVYGLSDVNFFKVTTSSGEKLMGVEIAGSTPQDLEDLIAQQGKFEAQIANQTVFTGGEDIAHVGRTGQDSMVHSCKQSGEEWFCQFTFTITLTPEAADNYANITKDIPISTENPEFLEEKIFFYVDDEEVSSLLINKNLRGSDATKHSIQGSGSGLTQQQAYEATKTEMKKLQTVLITGSLPFKLEIVKLDRISPRLGETFTQNILYAGLFAILAVSLFIFARYRKIKISLALISVSLSEVLIILGIASLINWNLDLPSIAGIIAAIGTGIDSQIIILDEARVKGESMKEQIKKALFIIMTAFTTTFVALIPLTGALGFMGIGAASAGLLKGFAVTTIIGISVGVLISRPAFAEIARRIEKE